HVPAPGIGAPGLRAPGTRSHGPRLTGHSLTGPRLTGGGSAGPPRGSGPLFGRTALPGVESLFGRQGGQALQGRAATGGAADPLVVPARVRAAPGRVPPGRGHVLPARDAGRTRGSVSGTPRAFGTPRASGTSSAPRVPGAPGAGSGGWSASPYGPLVLTRCAPGTPRDRGSDAAGRVRGPPSPRGRPGHAGRTGPRRRVAGGERGRQVRGTAVAAAGHSSAPRSAPRRRPVPGRSGELPGPVPDLLDQLMALGREHRRPLAHVRVGDQRHDHDRNGDDQEESDEDQGHATTVPYIPGEGNAPIPLCNPTTTDGDEESLAYPHGSDARPRERPGLRFRVTGKRWLRPGNPPAGVG
ncbi:MAG: hypothetical protein QG608_3039, partial [Actinomycetota bacterium]|nr:hypothetical protein [Actinomycetota bacterium]